MNETRIYHADQPMAPLLDSIAKDADKAAQSIDMSHPLQRIFALERLVDNLAWIINKLVRERDAALRERRGG